MVSTNKTLASMTRATESFVVAVAVLRYSLVAGHGGTRLYAEKPCLEKPKKKKKKDIRWILSML